MKFSKTVYNNKTVKKQGTLSVDLGHPAVQEGLMQRT